jgi:hypothetical protein
MALLQQGQQQQTAAQAKQQRLKAAIDSMRQFQQGLDASAPKMQMDWSGMAPQPLQASHPRAASGGFLRMMRGGYPFDYLSTRPGLPLRQYAQGSFVPNMYGGGGRADNIDAKLSPGEFVMDAETTSLLGDGNPEEGARKFEQLRQNIRRHKGHALAHGDFSPDARTAEAYLGHRVAGPHAYAPVMRRRP